ncbi:hypothetical protein ElP_56920 [Tautonia plasticadhaerens]|uniref:Plasmid stabilization protein n=1 Tax=Tautonia plasticadhaerens TaxID=2527974 RepID=A0A518HAG7_9BACT|nr:hypothetical protein ElP_56920 [Tautonia plasticadhaerens]
MPRGDNSKDTDAQKRKAEHIAEGYEERGVPVEEAERRAWATVNKESGGGRQRVGGRTRHPGLEALQPGGWQGGRRGVGGVHARGAIRFGEEGGRDPHAECGGRGRDVMANHAARASTVRRLPWESRRRRLE